MSAVAEQSTAKKSKVAKAESEPKYLTIKEFADYFHLSVSGVHKAIGAGKIDFVELPGAGEKVTRRIPFTEVKRIETKSKARKHSA
jgi:hypothetical protein